MGTGQPTQSDPVVEGGGKWLKQGTGRLRGCTLQHASRDVVEAVEALESGLQGWVGWSVQPAASRQPPSSHVAWIVVVVIMVAMV